MPPAYEPALQGAHADVVFAPGTFDAVPTAQLMQPMMLCPVNSLYVPTGHDRHAAFPL